MPLTTEQLRFMMQKKAPDWPCDENFLQQLPDTTVGHAFLTASDHTLEKLSALDYWQFISLIIPLILAAKENKPENQGRNSQEVDISASPYFPSSPCNQPEENEIKFSELIHHRLESVNSDPKIPDELKQKLFDHLRQKSLSLYNKFIEQKKDLSLVFTAFPDEQELAKYFDRWTDSFFSEEAINQEITAEEILQEERTMLLTQRYAQTAAAKGQERIVRAQRDQETASTESISMGQEDACAALLRNQEMDQAQQSIRMAQQYTQAAAMVRLREEAELAAAAIPLSEEDALAKAAYQEMTRAIECRQIEENRRFAEAERREKEQQEFLISEGQRLKREIEQYQIECSKNSILKKPNKKKADAYHKYYAAQELLDALAGKDRTYKNIEACKTALDTSYSQDLKNKKGISMTLGDVLCANNDSWGMSIWRWIKNLFHPRSLSPADYGKKLVEDTNRFFGNAKRQKQELINMPSIPAFRGPSSSPAA